MYFLWLSRDLPTRNDNGANIYSNGLIRGLLGTGTTGTLISYAHPDDTPARVPGLTARSTPHQNRLRAFSLLSSLQAHAYQLKGKRFAALVRTALSDHYDVVIVDYFAMGWVLPILEAAWKGNPARPALVYVSHNYEPEVRRQVAASADGLFLRQLMKLDAEKAARLDLSLVKAADLIVANTDEDKHAYEKDAPGKPVLTLVPAYDGEILPTRPIDANVPRRAVITGTFDWIAKQNALRRFVAAAEEPFRRSGIELHVVGRVPQPLLDELSAKSKICHFTGWVEDVRPHLRNSRIGVMPDDVGGGFKHKYLYYIFSGLAVAAIRSQISGLPVNIDRDMIARDDAKELAEAIVGAMDDIPRLNEMRENCWNACATAFSWTERGQKLREALEAISKR
jgi:polysaccharide biosynthesis protein PslH